MFSNLSDKLAGVFKSFRNKGKLTEADVKEGMREIKLALLEADVNFKVVREFVKKVSERAVGDEVLESLMPAQHVVKIVNEELCAIMGTKHEKIEIASKAPTVVMMCGLQGAGKTTHTAKLALHFKKQGKRSLLAACDIYRPAAIKQLQVVGEAVGAEVFTIEDCRDAVKIAREAVKYAERHGHDMVFLDTAGRLHVDEELMAELSDIKKETSPHEIILVVDAMLGQDAVNVAESFNNLLDISGVILTKLDGDTRGGAALSVKYVTGKPIKYVGTGEKLENLEPFHPERMASRILGMGDVLSLIEKAQENFDEKKAAELEKRLREQKFTLTDFLDQYKQLRSMGNLDQLMGMIPGMKPGALKDAHIDENLLARQEAMILSMTEKEREDPDILNASRKRRIAAGSGTSVEELNRFLKQYEQVKAMMKQFTGKGAKKKFGKKGMFPF